MPQSGTGYTEGRFQLAAYAKFNRPDPMRDWNWLRPHTFNLYQYCGNDPINHWDPNGFANKDEDPSADIRKIHNIQVRNAKQGYTQVPIATMGMALKKAGQVTSVLAITTFPAGTIGGGINTKKALQTSDGELVDQVLTIDENGIKANTKGVIKDAAMKYVVGPIVNTLSRIPKMNKLVSALKGIVEDSLGESSSSEDSQQTEMRPDTAAMIANYKGPYPFDGPDYDTFVNLKVKVETQIEYEKRVSAQDE